MSMLLLAISYFLSPGIAGGCLWCYQPKQKHPLLSQRMFFFFFYICAIMASFILAIIALASSMEEATAV